MGKGKGLGVGNWPEKAVVSVEWRHRVDSPLAKVDIALADDLAPRAEKKAMNIHLTPQLEEMVKARVATGRYTSASELVREALRLFEEREQLHEMRLAELRRDLQKGLDEAARGEGMPFNKEAAEDIKKRGMERLGAKRKEAQKS
jgi:antitoxin ParD1/3/4